MGLRYDGLYESEDGNYGLRFYEDGTVLNNPIQGAPPSLIAKMFNMEQKDDPVVAKGVYSVNGSKLKFSTTTSEGTVEYEGTIEGEVLKLNSHSLINDYRDSQAYRFTAITATASEPPPPTAKPAPNASPSLSGPGVLYICGGEPNYLAEERYGVGQLYLYGDGPKDFKYSLPGDIQGSSYTFDLWLASTATTTVDASIIVQQGGKETVLASASFTAKSQKYEQFSSTVTGLDPTTAKGDILILRLSASGAMQGGTLKPGGLAYGADMASAIKIPPVK